MATITVTYVRHGNVPVARMVCDDCEMNGLLNEAESVDPNLVAFNHNKATGHRSRAWRLTRYQYDIGWA